MAESAAAKESLGDVGHGGEKKNRTFFILAEVIRFSIVRFAVYAADADAK